MHTLWINSSGLILFIQKYLTQQCGLTLLLVGWPVMYLCRKEAGMLAVSYIQNFIYSQMLFI